VNEAVVHRSNYHSDRAAYKGFVALSSERGFDFLKKLRAGAGFVRAGKVRCGEFAFALETMVSA